MPRPRAIRAQTPAAAPAPAALPRPLPGLVLRDADRVVGLSDAGLADVRATAAAGGSQRLIASRLGMKFDAFRKLLDRDETARLAWEAGKAEDEQALVAYLRAAAASGYAPAAMFLLKSVHGFVEVAAPASQQNIIITNGPVSLPAPLSIEAYNAKHGVLAPPIIDVTATEITKETDQ